MTRTRQATAAFVIAAVGMVAAPCYAQRGERRHGPGNGGGQHAQARGGGREAQPQTQRDVPRRESRQAAQATPRGGYRQQPQARSFQQPQSRSFQQPQARSFQQPQSRGRSGGRESWQPQSQPRGNFRQPVEPRGGSSRYSGQVSPPRYGQQPERRALPRAGVEAYGRYGNRSSDNRHYDNQSQGYRGYQDRPYETRGYAPPRSYGRSYGYRGDSYGYRPYGYRSYVVPYGYRPHGYRPGWSFNFYFGRPYGYYDGGASYGYYAIAPGFVYGSVRIVDAPPYAQVFVDGYYAGVVDDYDGVFQHLNLEPGSHRIEIELPGYPAIGFDVFVQPGETITYRANIY